MSKLLEYINDVDGLNEFLTNFTVAGFSKSENSIRHNLRLLLLKSIKSYSSDYHSLGFSRAIYKNEARTQYSRAIEREAGIGPVRRSWNEPTKLVKDLRAFSSGYRGAATLEISPKAHLRR